MHTVRVVAHTVLGTVARSLSEATISGTVAMAERFPPPRRGNNKHEREHEWITHDEFKEIRQAAAVGRHGSRNSLMLLMAFRHGFLRSSWCD